MCWCVLESNLVRTIHFDEREAGYGPRIARGTKNQEVTVIDNYESIDTDIKLPADDGTAHEGLIERWAEVAVSRATVRAINDPAGVVATVEGIDGAWGFGQSEDEALDDLRSVLVDWASLKLEDGDDDIPSMEGVHLVAAP